MLLAHATAKGEVAYVMFSLLIMGVVVCSLVNIEEQITARYEAAKDRWFYACLREGTVLFEEMRTLRGAYTLAVVVCFVLHIAGMMALMFLLGAVVK